MSQAPGHSFLLSATHRHHLAIIFIPPSCDPSIWLCDIWWLQIDAEVRDKILAMIEDYGKWLKNPPTYAELYESFVVSSPASCFPFCFEILAVCGAILAPCPYPAHGPSCSRASAGSCMLHACIHGLEASALAWHRCSSCG